jgi:hypothetical protein
MLAGLHSLNAPSSSNPHILALEQHRQEIVETLQQDKDTWSVLLDLGAGSMHGVEAESSWAQSHHAATDLHSRAELHAHHSWHSSDLERVSALYESLSKLADEAQAEAEEHARSSGAAKRARSPPDELELAMLQLQSGERHKRLREDLQQDRERLSRPEAGLLQFASQQHHTASKPETKKPPKADKAELLKMVKLPSPSSSPAPSTSPSASPSTSPSPLPSPSASPSSDVFDGRYPNLWRPVATPVADEVSDCADGRLARHCKRWVPGPGFETDAGPYPAGAVAATDSEEARQARVMAANKVEREALVPNRIVLGPPVKAPQYDGEPWDLYEIGDYVDCIKGAWKPGRVVGKYRFKPGQMAWGYDVTLDQGGMCKMAPVFMLRPHMEGMCLRFHFPVIPIPPILVSALFRPPLQHACLTGCRIGCC